MTVADKRCANCGQVILPRPKRVPPEKWRGDPDCRRCGLPVHTLCAWNCCTSDGFTAAQRAELAAAN